MYSWFQLVQLLGSSGFDLPILYTCSIELYFGHLSPPRLLNFLAIQVFCVYLSPKERGRFIIPTGLIAYPVNLNRVVMTVSTLYVPKSIRSIAFLDNIDRTSRVHKYLSYLIAGYVSLDN